MSDGRERASEDLENAIFLAHDEGWSEKKIREEFAYLLQAALDDGLFPS